MRLVRLLALRQLRRRPLRAALAAVAVAAGCAMAVSVLVVRMSVTESVDEFARTLAGPTELRVVGAVGDGGLEPEVIDAISATEGVASVVPMVQTMSIVDVVVAPTADAPGLTAQRAVTVLGVDCRIEALIGPLGCTPSAVAGVEALAMGPDMGVGAGRQDVLRTHDRGVLLHPAPVIERLASVGDGRVVVFGLEAAQGFFGRGDRLDVAYVDPEPGADVGELADRLRDVVGEHNGVLPAAEGPPEVASVVGTALPLFTLIALFAMAIGGMLVHNTAALSLAERRRDLSVVAALGGTASTIAAASLTEAAVVGAVGGAVGAAGGVAVARPIVASLSVNTFEVAGVPLAVHVSWSALAISVAIGAALSVAAAAGPVRRALRADVAAELSGRAGSDEAAPPALRRRAVLWSLVAVASLVGVHVGTRDGALAPWQATAGPLGFVAATIATLVLGMQLAPLAVGLLGRVPSSSAPIRLAVANLRREPRRTGVMVAAVGAAATTAFITAGYARGVEAAILEDVTTNLHGVEVIGDVGDTFDTGLDPALLRVLEDAPGAAAVHRGVRVVTGTRPEDLVTVTAFEDPWLADEPVRGTLDRDRFASGEAIVNTSLARARGLLPGDMVRLATPSGMVEVPVLAVVHAGGVGGRSVQIPYDLHQRLYGPRPSQAVVVEPEAGVSDEQLRDELWHAIDRAGLVPDVSIETPEVVARRSADSVAGAMVAFWTLQRGLLVVSFVAVVSTLLLVGIQRRRELATLGAVGMEPGAIARMVAVEAGIVGLVAAALNCLAGPVLLWALNRMAPVILGWSNPLRPDWLALLTWGAVSLLVALAAAVWPAKRAAGVEVVPALQVE